MIALVFFIFIAVAAFLAGFVVMDVVSAGAQEERRLEFLRWCEERCGAQCDIKYEWRDGDDG